MTKFVISYEVGGQDIDWRVEYSHATPDTEDEPGCDAEIQVEKAMLLTHFDGYPHRLDILDLVEEAGGGELPEPIYSALLERAEQLFQDEIDAEQAVRAEAEREG